MRYEAQAGLFKTVRENLGMSQTELAQRMGVAFQTVNRWELGKTRASRMAQKLLKELEKTHSEEYRRG